MPVKTSSYWKHQFWLGSGGQVEAGWRNIPDLGRSSLCWPRPHTLTALCYPWVDRLGRLPAQASGVSVQGCGRTMLCRNSGVPRGPLGHWDWRAALQDRAAGVQGVGGPPFYPRAGWQGKAPFSAVRLGRPNSSGGWGGTQERKQKKETRSQWLKYFVMRDGLGVPGPSPGAVLSTQRGQLQEARIWQMASV